MESNQSSSANTFRLVFLRRKIRNLFQSPTVKAVLLNELRVRGPDAELLVQMLDKVQASKTCSTCRASASASTSSSHS